MITLTYANAHDAFDDAAWYIDGQYLGRDDQLNVPHDILPRLNGKTVQFREVVVPEDTDPDSFFWPKHEEEL